MVHLGVIKNYDLYVPEFRKERNGFQTLLDRMLELSTAAFVVEVHT